MSGEGRSLLKDRIRKRYLFFLIPGILLLLLGLVTIALNASFVNRAMATEGIVVEVEVVHAPPKWGNDVDYNVIVEFRTTKGLLVRLEEKDFFKTYVGDKVKVFYNPSNPFEAMIYTAWWFWGAWSLIAFLGAASFVAGLWGWLSKRKSQRESQLKP